MMQSRILRERERTRKTSAKTGITWLHITDGSGSGIIDYTAIDLSREPRAYLAIKESIQKTKEQATPYTIITGEKLILFTCTTTPAKPNSSSGIKRFPSRSRKMSSWGKFTCRSSYRFRHRPHLQQPDIFHQRRDSIIRRFKNKNKEE